MIPTVSRVIVGRLAGTPSQPHEEALIRALRLWDRSWPKPGHSRINATPGTRGGCHGDSGIQSYGKNDALEKELVSSGTRRNETTT